MPTIQCRAVRAEAVLPARMTEGAAGFDLTACIEGPIRLAPGQWRAVPTGLSMEIPDGFEGVVRPRSGLALRHAVGLVNAPGTIDSDYRGEVQVLLINWGTEAVELKPGERIAQLVIQRVEPALFVWADSIGETDRGAGGFGHTGRGGIT